MTDADVQEEIANLKARLLLVEEKVKELHVGLIGSVQQPGALELIRRTSDSVVLMRDELRSLVTVVEQFKQDRWTVRGMIVAVGLFSGLMSWISTLLFQWMRIGR